MKKTKEHFLLSTRCFFQHFIRNLILGFIILVFILAIGILCYHYMEKTGWLDSYANVAFIVSGVGAINNPETLLGKIFIPTYSLVGGASFLLVVAVVFAPIFHWLFRHLKVEDREHFKD